MMTYTTFGFQSTEWFRAKWGITIGSLSLEAKLDLKKQRSVKTCIFKTKSREHVGFASTQFFKIKV